MGEERTLVPEIGQRYKVLPINIVKAKNAGRICTLLELDDNLMPQNYSVKCEDTGRKGSMARCQRCLHLNTKCITSGIGLMF